MKRSEDVRARRQEADGYKAMDRHDFGLLGREEERQKCEWEPDLLLHTQTLHYDDYDDDILLRQ